MYQYKAFVKSVYDGDSITVIIELGFKATLEQNIRILGIDCPEIRTLDVKEKEAGLMVRDYLRKMIEGKEVTVLTRKPDKFGGRYLADVYSGGVNVAKHLINNKFAREYHGTKKIPFSEWWTL